MIELTKLSYDEYILQQGDDLKLDYVFERKTSQFNGSLEEYLLESYNYYLNYSAMTDF